VNEDEEVSLQDLRQLPRPAREVLCRRFYESLYLLNFANPALRERLEAWLTLLGSVPASPQPILHVIVATAGDAVRGGLLCEYYQRSSSGLATYLVVDAAYRRRGLGRQLLTYGRHCLAQDAAGSSAPLPPPLYAETEDPRRMPEREPTAVGNARLSALSRLGFLGSSLRYVQPSLGAGQPSADWLILLVHRSTTDPLAAVTAGSMRAFLREFYLSLVHRDPDENVDFRNMARWLDEHDPVPLWPLDRALREEPGRNA
jgi:GNAT superfamily N-acetyltransferase